MIKANECVGGYYKLLFDTSSVAMIVISDMVIQFITFTVTFTMTIQSHQFFLSKKMVMLMEEDDAQQPKEEEEGGESKYVLTGCALNRWGK